MTITTVPAGGYRAAGLPPGLDRNALPDELAIQQLQTGLEQGIQREDHGALRTAVTQFRDVLPKLSLWERIKDFWGLSDTADNRRDAAALCVIAAFYEGTAPAMNSEAYNQAAMTLTRILQETGLVPDNGYTEPEKLTADITIRLLAQSPDPEGLITLRGDTMTTSPETGAVSLVGRVIFRDATNMPELLRNMSLSFVATASSPLVSSYSLRDALGESWTLPILFRYLTPEDRMSLQLLSCLRGSAEEQLLFSAEGLLGSASQLNKLAQAADRVTPSEPEQLTTLPDGEWDCINPSFIQQGIKMVQKMPPEATVRNISGRDNLTEKLVESFNDTETLSTVWGKYPFVHDFPQDEVETLLRQDLHRANLHTMVVMINKTRLSPEITRNLQAIANIADDRAAGCPAQLLVRGIGRAWTQLIQSELEIDDTAARQATAALMYASCQGGAVKSTTETFVHLGPPADSMNRDDSQSVLNIDTATDGRTTVTQAQLVNFHWRSRNYQTNQTSGTDFRMAGVSFQLPASNAGTESEMVRGFMQANINVEGFGVRCSVLAREYQDLMNFSLSPLLTPSEQQIA